jgi:hypothetical protein
MLAAAGAVVIVGGIAAAMLAMSASPPMAPGSFAPSDESARGARRERRGRR